MTELIAVLILAGTGALMGIVLAHYASKHLHIDGGEMGMNTDLSEILRGYSNKWVALSFNCSKVVGVGNSPKKALEQAHKNKEENPILTRVPKDWTTLI